MKRHSIIIIFLFSIVFFSCRVGKDYHRPDMPVPQQFAANTATDSSMGNISWRNLFADPNLQQLIDTALASNVDMQLATKRIEAAEAYFKQAKVAWLPSLTAQATGATNIPSKNSLNGLSIESFLKTNHIEDYNASLTFSWEIDVWGKIRRQKEAAFANYMQTAAAARAVKTRLVTDISQRYFSLLMLDEQLSIAQSNLALTDTIVDMMRLQKTAGDVTELAVQQTIYQQQNAQLLVSQLKESIAIQENTIRILSGTLPATVERHSNLEDMPLWDKLYTGIPAEVIANRPDVKASELQLVAANARVGVAEANRYPTLNITANGGVNAYKIAQWFTLPGSLFATAAGSLTQPVFQRRALKTQYEVAKVEREEAAISFRQQVLDAVGEVSNALVHAERLKEQYDIAQAQASLQQKAVQNAQLLFKSGMANYLEVITAQSNAFQATLSRVSIRRQQLDNMTELYRALGGGWQ